MKRPKLVVIGNGMAGVRALEELLALAPELYEITVFGAEPHPNYNRIMLSPVLAGELRLEDIVLNDRDWYRAHGIALHTGRRVVAIDRSRRLVVADDGSTAEYDRLLIATGSVPVRLPVPGADAPGVLTYRDIADTHAMIEASTRLARAAVIGGGLLGLEAAYGLHRRGMDVTVVHLGASLMDRQLDAAAAGVLQRSLEQRGLRFLLSRQTADVRVHGAGPLAGLVAGLRFADGEALDADLVVMAVGIRPDTALAERAGLRCARGIVVDDTMMTFDPRIYAVGECASHRGTAYGLVAPLFEQARVAANHLARVGDVRYAGTVTSARLKVTGVDVFSVGDHEGVGADCLTLADPAAGVYKKVVLRDDRLVGACLVGDTADAGWYLELLRDARPVVALRDRLLFGRAAADAAPGTAPAATEASPEAVH